MLRTAEEERTTDVNTPIPETVTPDPEFDDPLTQREIEQVIMAVVHGQGTASDADLQAAVSWAREARLDAALLECVLTGRMFLKINPDEPDNPSFIAVRPKHR